MVNFPNDTENEDDYAIGWGWHEVNPGPMIGLYNGFRQCLLDPTRNRPQDFFNALFENRMYTIMAKEINKYAQQRKQACEYFNFLNILFTKFSKNVNISHDFQEKSGFQKKSGFTYIYQMIYPGLQNYFSLFPLRLMPCHALLTQLSNVCIDLITIIYQNISVMIGHHFVEFR